MSLSRASARFRDLTRELGEVIEVHDRAKDIGKFQKYEDDLPAFAWDLFDIKLTDQQLEIDEALKTSTMVSVAGANAVGKDFYSALKMIHQAVCRRGLAILTAATQRQAIEVCMGEVHRLFKRAPDLPGELFRSALRIESEEPCGIVAMASTEASKLTGFHAARLLAVLSEAQALQPWVLEAFLSCAVGDQDRILAVGNMLFAVGWFAETVNSPMWTHLRHPATEHVNVIEGKVIIPGGPTRQWIETMRLQYGEGSNTYRSRVLAIPPDEGEQALFARSWLDRAVDLGRSEAFQEKARHAKPILGVDLARFGPDLSVVAVRKGDLLTRFVSWHKVDARQSLKRIIEVAKEEGVLPRWAPYGPWGLIVVDSIGVGGPVLDFLKAEGWPARGFNASESPLDKDRFLNRRAEAAFEFARLLEEEKIGFAEQHDQLWDELLAIEWKPSADDAKVQLVAKTELKAKLGRSPDFADAAILAFYRPATWRTVVVSDLSFF